MQKYPNSLRIAEKIHRRYAQKGCTVSNTKHRSRASVIAYVWMWEVMGVKRSQRRWREGNQTAARNLDGVKKGQQMWSDVNNNAFPNLEGNRRGKRRSTKLLTGSTELNGGQQKSSCWPPLTSVDLYMGVELMSCWPLLTSVNLDNRGQQKSTVMKKKRFQT